MTYGGRVYGLGVMAMATLCLAWGTFDTGQPVPKDFPERAALAYAIAIFMFVAGAAIEWRRTRVWGAAALTAFYTLIVLVLMNGRVLLAHYGAYGTYENIAEQLAIVSAGLILYATNAKIDRVIAARLIRLGRIAFGICALIFGGAHFVYMNLTAPLVPKWLPPGQVFWADVTGVAQIAAGLAILTGVQARLAAILLTAMYVSFTLLVHAPMLWASPANHWIWTENAVNLALIGVAWTVADSLNADRTSNCLPHEAARRAYLPKLGGVKRSGSSGT